MTEYTEAAMAGVHMKTRVHLAPWWWVAGGVACLFLADLVSQLSPAGWAAGAGYLLVSTTLLTVGLARRGDAAPRLRERRDRHPFDARRRGRPPSP